MKITKPVFVIFVFAWFTSTGFVCAQTSSTPPIIENPNRDVVLYCSDPVAVAPAISIENIQINEAGEGMKISISDYKRGEDILEYDKVGSFQYRWNENSGYLEITGIGTDEAYEEAVSKVYYRNTSSSPTTGIRSFSISLSDADYLPATDHFYRFVRQYGISWSAARTAASAMDYYGLKGYLSTIRSKAEQDFISTKTEGTGWIGGSDAESEGTWKWVTGPAEDRVVFWQGSYTGGTVNGQYEHWGSGEPNNQGDEDYAHVLYHIQGEKGFWNDLPLIGGGGDYTPQGFLVEYGGMPGDPVLKLSAVARVEIRDSEHPVLDENIFSPLFCGTMQDDLQLAFTNGIPATTLTALDPSVIVTNEMSKSPNIQVPAYGNYYFRLDMIDNASCLYTDTIMLGFHNQPAATFNLDSSECYGYNLQLEFTGNTEEDAYFIWYYNESEFSSDVNLDSVKIPLGFENIERTVGLKVDEQGCIDSTLQEVKVKPDIIVSAENTVGCSPLQVDFTAATSKPAHSYNWSFSDGNSSDEQNPLNTFLNPGDSIAFFDVTLTVFADDGCDNTALYEDLAEVYPVPTAAFDLSSVEVLITDPEVAFTNTSHAASIYYWDFGDSSMVSNELDPVHRYSAMNFYPVTLEVQNDLGCADTIMKHVTVTFDRLFPPTIFSPNASLEEDREFRLYGEGVTDAGYQLLVFDRWGGIVFESNSQTIGWDGKMENEEFAPAGVYTWVLQYTDFTGEKHKQKGTVSLLF